MNEMDALDLIGSLLEKGLYADNLIEMAGVCEKADKDGKPLVFFVLEPTFRR